MNEVILIYQEIPENIKVYWLHVDEATLTRLRSWHGHYINSSEWKDPTWLLDFIEKSADYLVYKDGDAGNVMLNNTSDQHLIVTGFVT